MGFLVRVLLCGSVLVAVPAAAAGPVDGTYRLYSVDDGKKTLLIADVIARFASSGEVVFGFDGNKLSFGMWIIGKSVDVKKPGEVMVSVCRSKATVSPTWTGKTFVLPFDVEAAGWSTASHAVKTHAGGKTKVSTMGKTQRCSFSLEKSSYAITVVKADADGPQELSIKTDKGVMVLERTQAIDDAEAERLATELGSE